jgi:cytochrome c oxidase assembly protein subunit 15
MAYFAIPAFLQPIHLLLATVTFGMQIFLLFELNAARAKTTTA